jgi:hypothetical protein
VASQALKHEMTDEEFDRCAMQVLARELGPGGLARFISLHRSGPGDYTRDRNQWLSGITIEDIERSLTAKERP